MMMAASARALILCTLVLLSPVVEARQDGGTNGTGAGSDGGGGNGSNSSGAGSFRRGNGVGSVEQALNLRTALVTSAAGAVDGIVTYEAGKAIIRSDTEPFHYESRAYYFDNYHRLSRKRFVCNISISDLAKLDSSVDSISTSTSADSGVNVSTTSVPSSSTPNPDNFFSSLQFRDGSRPKTLVWTCRSDAEVCCGTNCCDAPGSSSSKFLSSKIVHLILIGILVGGLVGCCGLVRKCCSSCGGDRNSQDANKYANNPPSGSYGQQQQQVYPMQSYGGGYPPQQR